MKNKKPIFFILALVMLIISTYSCNIIMKTIHPFNSQNNCPTNNPNYFFKKAGAKPTRDYVRNNRFTQRRHKY